MLPLPPASTLFPYTTLFRSSVGSDDRSSPHARHLSFGVEAYDRMRNPRLEFPDDSQLLRKRGRRCTSLDTRPRPFRSEEHTSELQSPMYLVCRLLLEKKKKH